MQFINPKTDFAFKRIFGSDQSKAILISFLNALLHNEQPVIEDLEILNPYLAPKIEGMKDTYVDVRARLRGGRMVIIEMQVLNVAGFEKRVLYNAAKAYSDQLDEGEVYRELQAVVALTITDFVMFKEHTEVLSAYVLKEKERLTDYCEGELELVFVELPKFDKELEELSGVKDKWLYFLKEAPGLEVVPEKMGQVPEIKRAFEIANEANMSREEKELQRRKLFFIQDQQNAVIKAENDGLTKGLTKGRAEGEAKGRDAMAVEIARRLLPQMNDEQVAAATGLDVGAVARLRAEN